MIRMLIISGQGNKEQPGLTQWNQNLGSILQVALVLSDTLTLLSWLRTTLWRYSWIPLPSISTAWQCVIWCSVICFKIVYWEQFVGMGIYVVKCVILVTDEKNCSLLCYCIPEGSEFHLLTIGSPQLLWINERINGLL